MSTEPFPGYSVISWFETVESWLSDVLTVVPYCEEHLNVWSPQLVTVLLEACSQIDSLYKDEFGEIDIVGYFTRCGETLAPRWLLFWAESSMML
jgi:hypothetical protein